jgi:glyoxylase-like metal-dependent hydrolase (beta-lactamase superfamily II)
VNYRIYPLKNGECVIAGNHAFRGGDPTERYPYYLYIWLIEGGEKPMLVDAGLRDVDEMNRGAAHVLAEPIKQAPEEKAQSLLARFGLRPEDIGWVFITHLHFDHVNELDIYENARIVVSRRGLEAATAFPGWRGSWAPWDTLDGLTERWRDRVLAVDDVEVLPGIRTMWLGGHSPCSQAIIVRTNRGKAVLTGDTVSLYANIERDIPVGVAYNYNECIEAMEKVRQVADIVLPGHDPEVLRRFPEGVIG